mmetsp:Transcript_10468/g.19143  ORF Transcript_10468/g.19143 Transcript_10468/m.19143 type:complete len:231 (-) Transcript_10468:951-1643(-)
MPITPARKKRTPKKPAPSTPVGQSTEDGVANLTSTMKMSVSGDFFCMDMHMPWFLYTFKYDDCEYCCVDFFAPTLPKDYFFPDISNGGNTLSVTVRIPEFFTKENRILKARKRVKGFNANSTAVQSFKTACASIDELYKFKDYKEGAPTTVPLPFTCLNRIHSWDVCGYKNRLGTLTDDLGGQQFHWCLTVTVQKLVSKIRVQGGFQIVDDSSSDEEDMDTSNNDGNNDS